MSDIPDDGLDDARADAARAHERGEEPEPDAGSGPVASPLAAPTYGDEDHVDGTGSG